MIQANELRIGNWYSNGTGSYTLSTSDFIDFLNEAQVNNGKVINIFQIPLTPEILVKAGFVKQDASRQSWYWYLGEARFRMLANGDIISHGLSARLKISSLHQLQNLYFALTGKDLDINLN